MQSETRKGTCPHSNPEAKVQAVELEDTGQWQAHLSMVCADCGTRFRFVNMQVGQDMTKPTTDRSCGLAMIPCHPEDRPLPRRMTKGQARRAARAAKAWAKLQQAGQ